MKNQNNFIEGIGNTPLIKLKAASEITGCNIYGKAEYLNPGGSVKDRAALALVKDAEENLMVNLVNPVIILTELSKKIIKNNSSFIAVFCSVAGLRGRKKQLYYSTSKSGLITFMSGLRQKLFNSNITVMTIIPGYMSTRPFREGNWNSPGFLITKPKKVALIIKEAVDKKKEIIYINTVWKFIMKIITSIPEKIYKRLSF